MAPWHREKWAPIRSLRPLVAKERNALGPVWEALLGACKIVFSAPRCSSGRALCHPRGWKC